MTDLLSNLGSMSQDEQRLFLKKLELKKYQLESAKKARDGTDEVSMVV